MEAASLLERIERSRKSGTGPLAEALTSALGDQLLAWLSHEHAQTPPRLHREAFAHLGCMSPEQARGRPLDVRSDVFSAGLLLFELGCGRPAYRGIHELVAGEVEAPKTANPAMSDALAAVLSRALALDPAERYATAHELRTALETAVAPAGPDAVDAWAASLEPSTPPAPEAAAAGPKPSWRTTVARVLGALVLVAVPVAVVLYTARAHEQQEEALRLEESTSLLPCELVSQPPGALVFIDGRPYSERTPATLWAEPGRTYVLELRSSFGSVTRKIRDQRKLVVRMSDGSVVSSENYGPTPAPPPAAARPPAVEEAPSAPAVPIAYDFESAPASFELLPEHQVRVPPENCIAVDGTLTTVERVPKGVGHKVTARASTFDLPLMALFDDGSQPPQLSVLVDAVGHEKGTLCVFMLTDRSNESAPGPAVLQTDDTMTKVRKPLFWVDGHDRVMVRSVGPGVWNVKVESNKPGFAPVMIYERAPSGRRNAVVLDQPVTPIANIKWLWLAVPVRQLDPDLRFSVQIEQAR